MPQGLQAWNTSGQLIFDITDRVLRMKGTQVITSGSGWINVAKAAGEYVYFSGRNRGGIRVQAYTVASSGSTVQSDTGSFIYWNVLYGSGGTCDLSYGVF